MAIQIAHYEYLFCPTVNKLSHVCQDGIFRGDNVTLDIPGGNSIRREENLSANSVSTNTTRKENINKENIGKAKIKIKALLK